MDRSPRNKPRVAPFAVAVQAARVTWAGFDTLLRLGWLAALLAAIAGTLLQPAPAELSADGTTLELAPGTVLLLLVLAVITALLQSIVAVAWQRELLLGPAPVQRRWHLQVGRIELTYALVAFFLLALAGMGIGMAPAAAEAFASGQALPGIFMLAGPVLGLAVVARAVLVLPGIAIGRPAELMRVWQAADGNTMRILAVILLVGVPVVVLELLMIELFGGIVAADYGLPVDLLLRFVMSLLQFVLFGAISAAVALLYMQLVEPDLSRRLPPAAG